MTATPTRQLQQPLDYSYLKTCKTFVSSRFTLKNTLVCVTMYYRLYTHLPSISSNYSPMLKLLSDTTPENSLSQRPSKKQQWSNFCLNMTNHWLMANMLNFLIPTRRDWKVLLQFPTPIRENYFENFIVYPRRASDKDCQLHFTLQLHLHNILNIILASLVRSFGSCALRNIS